jgi:hypothetical protein
LPAAKQLWTLQRRVKGWQAGHGPAKEVFFAQGHEPGRLGASDFAHGTRLGVTAAGVPLPHPLYHSALPDSNSPLSGMRIFTICRKGPLQ